LDLFAKFNGSVYNTTMFMTVQTEVIKLLPAHRKTSNKWISFNAPCCAYNGETEDRRKRGGILPSPDGSISYHCFNCGFKSSFKVGRALNYKFKKLLGWLGADDNTIQRLVVEALRAKDLAPEQQVSAPKQEIDFVPRPLPANSVSFREMSTFLRLKGEFDSDGELFVDPANIPSQLFRAADYLINRGIQRPKHYDFYITEETAYNLNKRVIIPFIWKGNIIGYTARALEDNIKPKYHNSHEPNFVFNTNNQLPASKFVVVTEGPFDAMAIDGVAVLSNEISDEQADIIDSLKREVIVVPDFDVQVDAKSGKKKWPGRSLIEAALDYGWSVSFPIWHEQYKDVADATQNLGQLFVLKSILAATQSNPLKIELLSKQIYNKL
jgi:hypothetical protein